MQKQQQKWIKQTQETRKERINCVKNMAEAIDFAKERFKEISIVYDGIMKAKDHKPLYTNIESCINTYNYNRTSLQNAITNNIFADYFTDKILDVRVFTTYAFSNYIDVCNDYFDLKKDAPEHYSEDVFNHAMEQYQKYKKEYDNVIIQTKRKIDDVRSYVSNSYNQDLQFKKTILQMIFNINKDKWINRARKTVMNDFQDFKKFCQVYIDFVKQFYKQEILEQIESEIKVAIG